MFSANIGSEALWQVSQHGCVGRSFLLPFLLEKALDEGGGLIGKHTAGDGGLGV